MVTTALDSPLLRMMQETPTQYWNDSCAVEELAYAVERGATGATSNPSIVLEVLKKEKAHWVPRVHELAAANPDWSELDLTWAIVEEMAARGAAVLQPGLRAGDGTRRPSLAPDEPGQSPAPGTHGRAGAPVPRPRPEHAGQVPGHRRGDGRDRGGDALGASASTRR